MGGFGLKLEMGSYGKLAKRAVETEMPVMIQVFEAKPRLSFVLSSLPWN